MKTEAYLGNKLIKLSMAVSRTSSLMKSGCWDLAIRHRSMWLLRKRPPRPALLHSASSPPDHPAASSLKDFEQADSSYYSVSLLTLPNSKPLRCRTFT